MKPMQQCGDRDSADRGGQSVVIIGNYRPALAAARCLKSMGYRVVLGAEPGSAGAERSRFVDAVWSLSEAELEAGEFRTALAARLECDESVCAVIPITEHFLNLVEASRDIVPDHVTVVAPQGRVLQICHDKYAWLRFCRDIGIACPRFAVARSRAELRRAVEEIGRPVVIRPVEAGKRIGKRKAVPLERPAGLDIAFPTWPTGLDGLLVQRRFAGDRYNVYFGALEGRMVRELHSRSVRTDRLDGSGQTIEGEVVPPVAVHSAMLAESAAALNYTGIGCAQFLHDRSSGESCFLEINPRFGASHAFVEHAGLELTRLALDLARMRAPRPLRHAIRPVRFVWTYGDLSGLAFSLQHREATLRQAAGWAAAAVRAAFTADVHVTWSWTDPLPALGFYWSRSRELARFGRVAAGQGGVDRPTATEAQGRAG